MVRQFKIHTNLDGQDNKVWDVTNGKLRLYNPSNLGLEITNNIFNSNGIGVAGSRVLAQPDIEFNLETFCPTLDENYKIINEFVNDILARKFVTLEYQTGLFQVYADLAMSSVTKTEGFSRGGTFSEKISFNVITKWYTYENLSFEMIENGEVVAGKSKIYGGSAPNGVYHYRENEEYTYYGERDITRLSRWDIQNEIFSVVARLDPSSSGEVGVKFLNEIGNEYTALLFDTETKQDYILINTDVNDEFYDGWTGTTKINLFPTLDFQRYRTRIIEKGQMTLQNLKSAEFKIKRKADFM